MAGGIDSLPNSAMNNDITVIHYNYDPRNIYF